MWENMFLYTLCNCNLVQVVLYLYIQAKVYKPRYVVQVYLIFILFRSEQSESLSAFQLKRESLNMKLFLQVIMEFRI